MTAYNKLKENVRFLQFTDNCVFKVYPCTLEIPNTKSKVIIPSQLQILKLIARA